MKVKLVNQQCAKYDGCTWGLYPVELQQDDGTVVLRDADGDAFYEKCADLGVLANKHVSDVRYYNDNPAVYGVPDPTVQVGKTTFHVVDLVDSAGWDQSDSGVFGVFYAEV